MKKADLSLKFRSVFESALDGIIIIDDRGRIEEINQAALNMFGYLSEEIIGQNVHILMPEPHSSGHNGYMSRYLETKKPKIIGVGREVEGLRKNGTTFPFRLAVSEVNMDDRVLFTGIIHDLTEEHRAKNELQKYVDNLEEMVEERTSQLKATNSRLQLEIEQKEITEKALVESQKLHKAVVENFPSGTISILDNNLNLLFIEGQGLIELTRKQESLIGKNYPGLLAPDVQKLVEQKLEVVLGGIPSTFEVELTPFTYRLRAVPLENEEGVVDRILVVNSNITQQKNAEREIFNSLQKEKELNELKSRFVSMASHEFRTPLSTILSSASLISKYNKASPNEKIERHTDRIRNNVRNLTMILNDFLSLEKLESQIIHVNRDPVNVFDCINDVKEDMLILKKKAQSIELDVQTPDGQILTDRFVLLNILTNLVSNAIKYSPDNGVITIRIERTEDALKIVVIDNGIGISDEDQEKLFTRFFRAGNASNIQGTGLGLHIVKRYAQLIDAELVFESKLNKGSSFGLILKTQEPLDK